MTEINQIRVEFQLLEEQEEYEDMPMNNIINRVPKRHIWDMKNPMEFYCNN